MQQELAATKQKVDLAKKKLKRARETREEAEELNVTAEVTAARHERALECVRAAPLEAPDGPGDPAEEAPADAAEASSVVDGLRPLWEYDADLEAADQQMEAHQADLDVLRSQMGIDAAEEGGNILQGVVVHEDAADNRATSEDGSVSHNVPSPAVEETALHMGKWPADPFIRPPGAPRDVSEVDDPEAGRLCLGALYVPEVSGVRLHFGLLNGKPVGLIAEIDDYQFEIRLRLGLRNMGTWSRHNFATARDDLAESGPVTNWIDRDQLLPGWGPAVATEYSVASTVRGSKQQYQVIVTGCDGPGWVLQLTCFRPLKFIGSALERSTFRLLRAVLEDSVIAPSGRMEAGHYVLERPTSHPAPRRSSFTYKIKSAEPSVPATGGRRKSTLSTDNADNSTTRENPVRAASTDNVASKRRPRVSAPRWVVVKDTVACLTMLLWTGSLAAGLTYRQEANLKFFWDGVLTYLMVSFMLVASAVIFGLVIAMSNFTHTREGAIREAGWNVLSRDRTHRSPHAGEFAHRLCQSRCPAVDGRVGKNPERHTSRLGPVHPFQAPLPGGPDERAARPRTRHPVRPRPGSSGLNCSRSCVPTGVPLSGSPAFEREWAAALEESRQTFSLAALYEVVQDWQGRLAHAPAVDAFVASGHDDSDAIDMAELRGRRRRR